MRNLINLLQTINEGVGKLSAGEINNRAGRFEKFIEKIKARRPFTLLDGDEVTVDPREAKRFTDLKIAGDFKGNLSARTTDDREIPLSKFAKTSDFGGGGVAAGQDASEAGKESLLVKPKDIGIVNKNIPAHALYDEIINNPILNSTDYGKVVIQLAEYIRAGEAVMLPDELLQKDKTKVLKAIVDYAGEYLGVLALLYDQTRFPARAKFTEWLGGDIGDLIINFPEGSNNNIADSYATITNGSTNQRLNISSKGTGGGAAPAISGLKIPDWVAADPQNEILVEFINICKELNPRGSAPSTITQGFKAMDLIDTHHRGTIPKKWEKFLPWSGSYPNIAEKCNKSIIDGKAGRPSGLPKIFQGLISNISSKSASDGGKLAYEAKKTVADAVNADALPGFQEVVLEILEMNFIQQYTDYKAGELTFATQWPAKLDGHISVENKCSAVDPKAGGLCFKLGRTDSSVSSEPGVADVDDIESEEDFKAGAEEIATGSAPRKLTPRQKLEKKKEQLQKRIDAFNKKNPDFNTEPVTGVGRSMRKR